MNASNSNVDNCKYTNNHGIIYCEHKVVLVSYKYIKDSTDATHIWFPVKYDCATVVSIAHDSGERRP